MADKNISRLRNGLQVDGRSEVIGAETVNVMFKDVNEKVVLCNGTTVPTGSTAGYAKGCLFIKTDAGAGTKGLYENQGTSASCDFNLVGSITSAEIADGAVSLAKLASAVASSHVIKFFKLGSTITTTALVGVAVGDLVISILADGTVTVATVATIDTLPADPADTTYVIVLRATS